MDVLVSLVGKGNILSEHVSLYEKLVLIAKVYFGSVALTEEFDSLFTLYNRAEDVYICVAVKRKRVNDLVLILKERKFPIQKVFLICIDDVDTVGLRLKKFTRDEVNRCFEDIKSDVQVKINYDQKVYDQVVKNIMDQDKMEYVHSLLTELITVTNNTKVYNEKDLKMDMHTLNYIDKYKLIVESRGEYFINVEVLAALTAYMIYLKTKLDEQKQKIIANRNGIKYHKLLCRSKLFLS